MVRSWLNQTEFIIMTCNYIDHEGCHEGNVRLVNGTVEKEGRLEICNNGIWGGICSSGFTPIDGYIACKQIGYDNGICLHLITYIAQRHNFVCMHVLFNITGNVPAYK